jgi:Putative lactococcus lactis phage r1t holin
MLTRSFWLGESGVLVRAIRTWSQTAIAAVGVGQTNLFSADLKNVLALASSAAILSILMSLDRNTAAGTTVAVETPAPAAEPLQAGYSGS